MHSKAKPPTKSERKRWDLFREIGCVYCWLFLGHRGFEADVGHLLDGGVRRGHSETVPSCFYHHRGILPTGCPDRATARRDLGPSLTDGSRPFRDRFGSDDRVLALVNRLIDEALAQAGAKPVPLAGHGKGVA